MEIYKSSEFGSEFKLSTGKVIYANGHIIGLNEPSDEWGWSISEGYDGGIWQQWNKNEEGSLTKEELEEIADYMIDLWSRFKKDLSNL